MRYFTMDLEAFVKNVYNIDLQIISDPTSDYYYFSDDTITVSNDEVVEVRSALDLPQSISDNTLKDAIRNVKERKYEDSYVSEYYQKVCEMLEEKIKKDFENLQNFFVAPDEITVDGKLEVKAVDFQRNELIFEGKIKKLEAYIVNCINGQGPFYYRDLVEFKETTYPDSIRDRIEGHYHWLKYLEGIYGTVYSVFQIDLQYVDYYGTLGDPDPDYTPEEIKEYLDECLPISA